MNKQTNEQMNERQTSKQRPLYLMRKLKMHTNETKQMNT